MSSWLRSTFVAVSSAAGLLLAASGAFAQTAVPSSAVEFDDAELFRPTTDASDYVTVYDSDTLPRKKFYLGLYADYAHDPIEIQFEHSGDVFTRVIESLGTAQLSGSYGLLDWLEIGLRIPGYFESEKDVTLGSSNVGGSTVNVGDVVLNGKLSLLARSGTGFGFAVLPEITLPTGSRKDFAGTGEFGAGGLLIADYYFTERLRAAVDFGGSIRDGLNDQLRYGGGLAYDFNNRLTGIAEAYGAADTASPFSESRKTPADAIGALRVHFASFDVTVGGGAGLTRGQGSPDFRAFVGLTMPKPKRGPKAETGHGPDLSQSRKTYSLQDRNGDGRPSPGDVLEYRITIVDTGLAAATNVVVDDPIPPQTAYIPGTLAVNGRPMSDAPGDDDAELVMTPAPAVRARVSRLGTSPDDNHAEISFSVTVDSGIAAPTPIVNQARASADDVPEFPLPPSQTMVFPSVPQHEHVIVGPEKLELTEEIHFEFDKAVIQRDSYPILKELGQVLGEYPDLHIRIEGNTDSVGSDEYNQKLSERRALAVRDFLVGLGIAKDRMQWLGRGETNPIASNETAAGRAMNRRTEFIVLNPEAVKNAVLQPQKTRTDLAPQSEPAWLDKGAPAR